MTQTGLQTLLQSPSLLRGRRIGLVTNATGIDPQLRSAINLLAAGQDWELTTLFAPEHGIHAVQPDGSEITTSTDPITGIPVYSLYGKTLKPTREMLQQVDLLVYDIQDIGARFYTFISTLAHVLDAAAEHTIPVCVLDRPNPINGLGVEGPLLQPGYESFVGIGRLPIRHGMTVGELARFFCDERGLDVELHISEMTGWQRDNWYDDTGLPWVMPSPNMPTLDTATVYPGTCLIEGTNVSEGRGTTRPFELLGAPWIDAEDLATQLSNQDLPGVRFRPAHFLPMFSKHQEELCHGIRLYVLDRNAFQPVATGIAILCLIQRLHPEHLKWRQWGEPYSIDRLAGSADLRTQVNAGTPWQEIVDSWQTELASFRGSLNKWLLY